MNFDMFCGQTLGIIGESGTGKSTLVLLLTKLYNCEIGKIKIDGTDVNDWNLTSLRNRSLLPVSLRINFVNILKTYFQTGSFGQL